MIGLLSIIAIGFFLGMRHATDPDHVIAVTTIVSRQRSSGKAALVGAFWGLGHSLTIFAVGCAIILFNLVIPPRIGLTMELSVGLMLILLGGWNLKSFFRAVPVPESSTPPLAAHVHSHAHTHGDYIHDHPHGHAPESHPHPPERTPLARLDREFGRLTLYQFVRPLVVGIVHGLAGSAAVTLLILATIRNPGWAITYLLVFGIGTIAGMMLITMSLASTFRYFGDRFENLAQRFSLAAGLVSVTFGLFLAYQICIVQGLFSSHPSWTPK
jgi:ABC-type nickel/cobalt efflux system permease component RcnA